MLIWLGLRRIKYFFGSQIFSCSLPEREAEHDGVDGEHDGDGAAEAGQQLAGGGAVGGVGVGGVGQDGDQEEQRAAQH